MAQQRQQLAKIAPNGISRLAGTRVRHFDDTRAIVIALQANSGVALDIGAIAGAPICSRRVSPSRCTIGAPNG